MNLWAKGVMLPASVEQQAIAKEPEGEVHSFGHIFGYISVQADLSKGDLYGQRQS